MPVSEHLLLNTAEPLIYNIIIHNQPAGRGERTRPVIPNQLYHYGADDDDGGDDDSKQLLDSVAEEAGEADSLFAE
jgi:hypothetical protein